MGSLVRLGTQGATSGSWANYSPTGDVLGSLNGAMKHCRDLGDLRRSGPRVGRRLRLRATRRWRICCRWARPKVFCVATEGPGGGASRLRADAAKQASAGAAFVVRQANRGRLTRNGGRTAARRGGGEVGEDDAWLTAGSTQVSRYWSRYRLVLVTNYRDFVLVGEDAPGAAGELPVGG